LVQNISGESLLISTCIGLQRKVGDGWQFQETSIMCPGTYEMVATGAARTVELTIPAGASDCQYRRVATAASAQPGEGESDIVQERTRASESGTFCF